MNPLLRLLIALPLWSLGVAASVRAQPPAASVPSAASVEDPFLAFHAVGGDRPFRTEIITEVLFDQLGFLWIGTREGLYLYDGQRFRRFQHEVQNPDSITSNGIRGIFEDSHQRLWVNTISGGLNLLDRATWTFKSWRHKRNDPDSLVHDGVFKVAEAPGGRLWVGTQAGLDLFDPASGKFTRQIVATGGEFVIDLMNDRDGRLWVATLGQGLYRQRADHSGFDPVPGLPGANPLDVFRLAQTADGTIWVGARDGLYRVDASGHHLRPSGLRVAAGKTPVRMVTALLPAPAGGLWVGTFESGLYWLAAGVDALAPVALGTTAAGSHQIDSGALALDRNGNLFVGTFGAGLLRADRRLTGLAFWREKQKGAPGLDNGDVYALLAPATRGQSPQELVVGSFGGGVDVIDLADAAVRDAPLPVDQAMQGQLGGITDLLRTRAGELWATTNEGVFRWQRQGGRFHYFSPDQASGPVANPGYSFALLEDDAQRVWVGSAGGGLYLYQPESDRFRVFRPVAGRVDSLPDDFVTALIEDRRGRLWVGTRSGGVGICRLEQVLHCQHLGVGAGPRDISHDHVTDLLEAPDGSIWVATAGGGLNLVLLDAAGSVASVRHWSRNDGLEDDNVMAAVYGPDGGLWMSTHGGLSRLDLESGRILNLTPSNGLPTAVFNPKAALRIGPRLYFGSAKGVVSILPGSLPAAELPPPTVIEAVAGLDAAQRPQQPAWQLRQLRVAWRTPFSLEFAVLGYDGGTPRFQYRFEDSANWIDLADRNQLTLHALEPGRHQLRVRGRRSGSGWTLAAPLEIDIVPPWWRRLGVQVAAVSLLSLLILGAFLLRMRELQRRNQTLQQLQGLREQALAEAHVSQGRLQEAFEMLRRMTMRLDAAKEKERRHLARELHDEFGQALTSAKINLGLALAQTPALDGSGRIRDTIGLIDGLIRQVRALSIDLRPPLLDEMGLVPALDSYLHAQAERSGVAIHAELEAIHGDA
ncbi:MAG TPA: two-component regulator propeller domain-containing protein, partial [Rhodanobacteraceae bacterium]|nr:two-component regulator propeller domain-containing protein [Rhodanobacteraceae bacterium]